jgi:hypothetical protein
MGLFMLLLYTRSLPHVVTRRSLDGFFNLLSGTVLAQLYDWRRSLNTA